MAVHEEVWTGEALRKFRKDTGFMERIPARNEWVKNRVIHFTDLGNDPEVLVDNTTYPIPTVDVNDTDIPISLKHLETTNTGIPIKYLHGLNYPVIEEYTQSHTEVLQEMAADLAIHALSPSSNTGATPVVPTTGTTDGETNAKKQITPKDIIKLKRLFDDLKIPKKDRILVLCPQHVEQLLNVSETFREQYKNIGSGTIVPKLFGFDIYEYQSVPWYVAATGAKKAFGSVVNPATDNYASTAFYAPRTFKASADPEMFYTEGKKDAEGRKTKVGFSLWAITMPKKLEGLGSIVSVAA
ncbi:hypothetical protein AD998_02035 [bacterium 336/3]|nr:hypothetical protein AD998_02035 [bacterium 336/3]